MRMDCHTKSKKGVIAKHLQEMHKGEQRPEFTMEAVRGSRTLLERVTAEGAMIWEVEAKDALMNSKSEGGRGKLVRFAPQVQRI